MIAYLLGIVPPNVAPIPPPGTVPKAQRKAVAAALPRPAEMPEKQLPVSWKHPQPGVPVRVVVREEGAAKVPVLEVVGNMTHVLDLQSAWEEKEQGWKRAVTEACDRVRGAMRATGSPLKGRMRMVEAAAAAAKEVATGLGGICLTRVCLRACEVWIRHIVRTVYLRINGLEWTRYAAAIVVSLSQAKIARAFSRHVM